VKIKLIDAGSKFHILPKEKSMSFDVTESMDARLIEVEVSGKLTKEAYASFVPMTEDAIKKHGKVRILFVMDVFHGWDVGALWEDIKFDSKHFAHIERLAIVGETKWEEAMAVFCRPFTTAKIKYFDLNALDEARVWINQ
jgi:hypothetical protein